MFQSTNKVAEGLHIEEGRNGYWYLKQTNVDRIILQTTNEANAVNAGKELAKIANWHVQIDVLTHFKANRPDLFAAIQQVVQQYDVATSLNPTYLDTKDALGYVTYRVLDEKRERIVRGFYIKNGLCIHQEPNQMWTIDHVTSATMLSELSSMEKAKVAAERMKDLFVWSDINVPSYIMEASDVREYLRSVKEAVERDEMPPVASEELELHVVFLQNDSIRSNWELFQQNWRLLNDMVGLDNVKEQIRGLLAQVRGKMRNRGKVKEKAASMHMVFAGPAGTGKTEVARVVSKLFFALGYLRKNVCVETDRSEIVGAHIGQTEQNMQRLLQDAMGGVLFIDEAYALASSEGSNDFGREAINVLIKEMEDNRGDLIVILAGYINDMEKLMQMNEGFRSRIRHHIHFYDYTPKQLAEIGNRMIRSVGYKSSNDVEIALKRAIEGKTSQGVLEGNARGVRNITENILDQTLIRIGKDTEVDSLLVTPEDVKKATTKSSSQHDEAGLLEIQTQALAELDQLIGMKDLKEEVRRMLNQMSVEKRKAELGIISEKPRLHMVFAGPAGTGKTTVAKIIAKFLKGTGTLSSGHFKKATRSDLVGAYQGHTAKLVREKVTAALGGVLLIDEAYNLVNGSNDTFGLEAVAELIEIMEDKKDDLVVILAGYENRMQELLSTNEGFPSRIAHQFVFPDYTWEDIVQITHHHLKKNELHMDEETGAVLSKVIREKGNTTNGKFDGNGRWASNFVAKIRSTQTGRLHGNIAQLTKEDMTGVIAEDIEQAIRLI